MPPNAVRVDFGLLPVRGKCFYVGGPVKETISAYCQVEPTAYTLPRGSIATPFNGLDIPTTDIPKAST